MAKKKKAIFLDRDGTIIKHVDYLTKVSRLKILPGAAKAISDFRDLGFLVFVVTNQAAVARGFLTESKLEKIHNHMLRLLSKQGAKIDGIYYCPHHPEAHTDVPEHAKQHRIECKCRKPAPGMILKAAKDYNLDRTQSFMIGDAKIDIVAGKRAKCKTIQVKSGPGHVRLDGIFHHIKPDFMAKNLLDSVRIIRSA